MWEVVIKRKLLNEIRNLPKAVQAKIELLIEDLKVTGPHLSTWSHYGPLKGRKDIFHCHIKQGRPTYVATWEIIDKKIKLMEVTYAGTHEKAPY